LALARLLSQNGNPDGAIEVLKQAQGDVQGPDVYELTGDLEAARGRGAEARAAYDQALKLTTDSAARKRITRKSQTAK
jgi:predicted negative regulator of RcsB-dependent stress response